MPLAEDGPALRVPPAPKLVEEPAPLEPARPEGTAFPKIAWAVAAAVLIATGYVAWQSFSAPEVEDPIGPLPPGAHTASPPEPLAPPEPDPTTPPEPDDPPEDLARVPPPYGREEPGIADGGASVAAGQGLVVLEPGPARLSVQIGDRRIALGAEPVGVPLAPGVHHLTYRRGDNQDFIWVAVHAGRTRYVPPLP